MVTTTVLIGVFDSGESARRAVDELERAGYADHVGWARLEATGRRYPVAVACTGPSEVVRDTLTRHGGQVNETPV